MPLATWQGPYTAFLPDGQLVRVGDEHEVTDGDLLSAHWQAVSQAATPAPAPTPSPFSTSTSSPASTPDGEAD